MQKNHHRKLCSPPSRTFFVCMAGLQKIKAEVSPAVSHNPTEDSRLSGPAPVSGNACLGLVSEVSPVVSHSPTEDSRLSGPVPVSGNAGLGLVSESSL